MIKLIVKNVGKILEKVFDKEKLTSGDKNNSRYARYSKIIEVLKKYSKTRMGYPYTGPIRGYYTEDGWIKDDKYGDMLIDNNVLGIVPESIAATYINNSGSPYSKSIIIQRDVKEIEVEIIKILENFFKCKQGSLRGYITSGSTEGTLSCLWWLREELRDYKDENIILLTSDQSHYSIRKSANILGLSTQLVKSNKRGEISLADLRGKIVDLVSKNSSKIILSLNVGTTVLGGIDDIISIFEMVKDLNLKHSFIYRIHTDAAILGPVIPLLKPFKEYKIFDYTDSLIFSGHKILGTTLASGIALVKDKIWENCFKNHDIGVSYIPGIEDKTIPGSRSGYNVIEFHNALYSLDLDSDAGRLKKLVNTYLKNCNYLVNKLKPILAENEVFYNENQFNVIFKSPGINKYTISFLKKYGLMQIEKGKLGVCVLANVDKKLIDSFVDEYKKIIYELR